MWLAPTQDAPDTHKIWADNGSPYERALKAAGWNVEVTAPGSAEQDQGDEPKVEPLTDDELTAARELNLPVDDPADPADPAWVRSELTAAKQPDEKPPVELSPETAALVASAKPRTRK